MTEKPYAGNDLGIEALRRYQWTRTYAVWNLVSSGAMTDPPIAEFANEALLETLAEHVKREIFHVLEGPRLSLSSTHADYFVRGWDALLAEVLVLVLKHPAEIFPYLEPLPRLAEADRRARGAVREARERLRGAYRAIRGEEADPWTS